jgi:hypothetical protein
MILLHYNYLRKAAVNIAQQSNRCSRAQEGKHAYAVQTACILSPRVQQCMAPPLKTRAQVTHTEIHEQHTVML